MLELASTNGGVGKENLALMSGHVAYLGRVIRANLSRGINTVFQLVYPPNSVCLAYVCSHGSLAFTQA